VDQREIGFGTAAADLAVIVEIEDADAGQRGRMEMSVEVACESFQIGPALAKAVDASTSSVKSPVAPINSHQSQRRRDRLSSSQ
jgi:hypothetical protein